MNERRKPALLRVYGLTYAIMVKAGSLIRMIVVGFWLGILPRNMLHRIDENFYDTDKKYCDDIFNRSGLFPWEDQMIRAYFTTCTSLRVASAGGGREMYALHQLGFVVDGFECHPNLVRCANRLFESEDVPLHVENARRDECPDSARIYNGFIVGWSAYTLIQGTRRRRAFLKQVHRQVADGGPVLLSFFHRPRASSYFRFVVTGANMLRALFREEMLELGDNLSPNYVHHFTEAELRDELADAGFDLIYYGLNGAGHAVALKRSHEAVVPHARRI
jgi:hypothetical protein